MGPDMRQAVDERGDLIEPRSRALAEEAIRTKAPRTSALGPRPVDRSRWERVAITIAAYRDRYGITTATPLGAARPTPSALTELEPRRRFERSTSGGSP